MEGTIIINLNEVAYLSYQKEVGILRIHICGMPLQPRIMYPDISDVISYLKQYGFFFIYKNGEESNIDNNTEVMNPPTETQKELGWLNAFTFGELKEEFLHEIEV